MAQCLVRKIFDCTPWQPPLAFAVTVRLLHGPPKVTVRLLHGPPKVTVRLLHGPPKA